MSHSFTYRSCYINFADHLLNSFNPNMFYPTLPHRWSDTQWFGFIDMIKNFGFNVFEFWLVPRLFCREGLASEIGKEFIRQMRAVCEYASSRDMKMKLLCSLTTVGEKWYTYCPNDKEEWNECLFLWDAWTKQLDGMGIVGIFPGDPGGCSRNGCTAETYIDKSIEVSAIIKKNIPSAEIELGTWGSPFFGWGTINAPADWKGEFVPEYQHSAWTFTRERAVKAMTHLVRRLKDFPEQTNIAINLAFNSDGDPQAGDGMMDARPWANEIAKTNPILTWDFSLTEGENAVIPHYRFERLFAQRKREREAAPYSGGICYTMTPLLNQLSLYMSTQSFMYPEATDYDKFVSDFYENLFGMDCRVLSKLLPLFEVIPDWGNYVKLPKLSQEEFNKAMKDGADLMESAKSSMHENVAFAPSVDEYRRTLLWYFRLFEKLSGPVPDYDALYKEYWAKVYPIYDRLPKHVDCRPGEATRRLIHYFNPDVNTSGPMAGKWTE